MPKAFTPLRACHATLHARPSTQQRCQQHQSCCQKYLGTCNNPHAMGKLDIPCMHWKNCKMKMKWVLRCEGIPIRHCMGSCGKPPSLGGFQHLLALMQHRNPHGCCYSGEFTQTPTFVMTHNHNLGNTVRTKTACVLL